MKKKYTIFLTLLALLVFFNSALPSYSLERIKIDSEKPITSGKGIWINIWNYPANPDMFLETLRAKGIETLYLQVARSNTPAIKHPDALNKILSSAHERGIKVIGWSYLFLNDPISDAQKFIDAVKYKTPNSETLDGVAVDIEEVTHAKAIETFTKRVREELGSKYPLIAITFSPVTKNPKALPANYAWKTIANNFDIIAPMVYWHGFVQYRSEKGAYDYTLQTISKLKEYTQKDNLKLHLIGDAQKTTSSEILGFLKAASDAGVDSGVSLYPYYSPQEHQLNTLSKYKF